MATKKHNPNDDRDPITGTPGAHPVATGVGTTLGGAAAGAAGGAIAGPVGAAVGAVVGGVVGGATGALVGEDLDTEEEEEAYWRENYRHRPYYSDDLSYDELAPAYRYGWESRVRYNDRSFEDAEDVLSAGWNETTHDVKVGWKQAREAIRDSWNRTDEKFRRRPR